MTTASDRRRERERDLRRQEIVDASVAIFSRDGFFGAKLEDIAETAGFSRSALYLHFPDGKEDLYLHAVLTAIRAREAAIQAVVDGEATSGESRYVDVWRAFCQLQAETPEYVKLLSSIGFEDIRTAVSAERLATIARDGRQSFRMLDEFLAFDDADGRRFPRFHVGWLVWAFFLGVVQYAESLEHVGVGDGADALLASALAVIAPGFSRPQI